MKQAHGWECINRNCGTYNSINIDRCRRCTAPRASGNLLYSDLPVVVEQLPPRRIYESPPPPQPASLAAVPGWAWALGGVVMFTLTVTAWPIALVGLFFALLWAIAAGIWRLVSK